MVKTDSGGDESVAEFTDDKVWVNCDVCLVSADGVRFRVQSYILAWARYERKLPQLTSSPVFADMLGLPKAEAAKELQLTDVRIEDADTLRLFLVLVSPCEFDLRSFFKGRWKDVSRQLNRLVTFLDKYNSEVGVRMLRLYSAEMVLRQTDDVPPCEFQVIFACMTKDLGLCAQLIERYCTRVWKEKKLDGPLGPHTPATFFEVHMAAFDFISSLPVPYVWALGRASVVAKPSQGMEKFRDKFVDLVKMILDKDEGKSRPGQKRDCRIAVIILNAR